MAEITPVTPPVELVTPLHPAAMPMPAAPTLPHDTAAPPPFFPVPSPTPIPGIDPHMPPIGQGPGEHQVPQFDAATISALERDGRMPPKPMAVDTTKADKIAADKVLTDKAIAEQEHGAKVLGDMETAIRARLLTLSEDLGGEYHKAHAAYIDMPMEIQSHTMYKPMGERLSSVEALLNTLTHTAASFPVPADAHTTGKPQ